MGTFMGHAIPGLFFLVYACWWSFAMFARYFKGRYKQGPPFRNSCTYPCSCCCGKVRTWQLEGFFKMVCCTIGIIGEVATGIDSHGKFVFTGNAQHATMFAFFGISGVVDLLVHYRVALPKHTDYCFAALCFLVEAILFKFHLHGRTDLDVVIHTLLLYVVVGCVLSVLAEMKWQASVLAGMARIFCTGLQGSWFIQVGYMLYPPIPGVKPWEGEDHHNIMLATIVFAWHMFAVFIFLLSVGLALNSYYGREHASDLLSGGFQQLSTTGEESVSMQRLINNDSLEEESETEFDRMKSADTKKGRPINGSPGLLNQ